MYSWEDEGPYYTYTEALLADMKNRSWLYEHVKVLPRFLREAIAQAKAKKVTPKPLPVAQRYRHMAAELSTSALNDLTDLSQELPASVIVDRVYWPNEPKALTARRLDVLPTSRITRLDDMTKDGKIVDVHFKAKLLGEKLSAEYVLTLFPHHNGRAIIRPLADYELQLEEMQKMLDEQKARNLLINA